MQPHASELEEAIIGACLIEHLFDSSVCRRRMFVQYVRTYPCRRRAETTPLADFCLLADLRNLFLRNSIFYRRFLNKQVMIKNNLFKGMCLLWLLLAATPVLQAQDRMQQASELLDRLIAGKGDSVYVHLDDNARKVLSVEMLNGLFKQLEQQVGKYQSHGEWKTEQINGMTIYYCDAKFERIPLRFLTAFNPDGKVNTIRFVPVPATNATPPTASVQDKIKETDIQVCTGSFKLPGTLTLPKNGKNLPVVILVHGSGPNDRDETVGVNKPFRDLAYGLAERGIAVIRYDKRTKVYGADSAPAGKEITFDRQCSIIKTATN